MQRHLLHIVVLLLVVTAVSCTRTSRHPQLVAADSLLLSQPDSALVLLRGMHFTSESDRMYHTLLLADACNKCYDTLPSDSLLREVADFYDSHGTPNEQVRAHYLLGCAYRDLGEAPQALDCYHDAIDHADTLAKDCNYRLLMSVYGQMAELFHKQNLPQDEIEAQRISGHYDLLNGDTIGYIRSLELLVKPYLIMGDTSKVFETVEYAQSLYIKHGNPQMAVRANGILIGIYVQRGELDKARTLIHSFENESGLFDHKGNIGGNRQAYYNIKGSYYFKNNQLDSAEYYWRKLLPYDYKPEAYMGLLSISLERKNADSIVKYAQLFGESINIQMEKTWTETVSQMSSMYNYHRFQQMAEQKERVATRLKRTLALVLLFAVFVVTIITYIYRRNKKAKQQEIAKLHSNYIQAQASFHQQMEELRLLKEDTDQLQKRKEQEIHQLRELIDGYKEKLVATTINEKSGDQLVRIVQTFRIKARGGKDQLLPNSREWKELIRQFKRNMPVEQVVICKSGLLSASELRACVLIVLDFSNTEMSILLDATPQRVTNLKSRINKKLFDDDSAGTLQSNLKYLSLNV